KSPFLQRKAPAKSPLEDAGILGSQLLPKSFVSLVRRNSHDERNDSESIPNCSVRAANNRPVIRREPQFERWYVFEPLAVEEAYGDSILARQLLHARLRHANAFARF